MSNEELRRRYEEVLLLRLLVLNRMLEQLLPGSRR